jgi:hypothetical protein
MGSKSWNEALRDALGSGAIAAAATEGTAALLGARQSGSAVAPLNASSHVIYGEEAEHTHAADLKHTPLGVLINAGASFFWAALYEKAFGAAADRGDVGKAFAGALAVAGVAYLTDYHVVPKRLTPGWEAHMSHASLPLVYGALALSLPLRGLGRAHTRA